MAVLFSMALVPGVADAANQVDIDAGIARAKQYLLSLKSLNGPEGALAAYSLLKADVSKEEPLIQKCAEDVLLKFTTSSYRPRAHHRYEAAVDAMFLEAMDPVLYQPQLALVANYLIAAQNPNGAWYYAVDNQPQLGDSSITQYGVLGLWACARAGVEIPPDVWRKAAAWLVSTQRATGGFAYQPRNKLEASQGDPNPTVTMTVAGTSTLLICKLMMGGGPEPSLQQSDTSANSTDSQQATSTKKFGVLERIVVEKPAPKSTKSTASSAAGPSVSMSAINAAIKQGTDWTADHFAEKTERYLKFTGYYFYGIERAAALLDVTKIGSHDWYDEGSTEMLLIQQKDGSWTGEHFSPVGGTGFALLFLSKATAKNILKPKRIPKVGGGILVGGRGLPDNLESMQLKDGQAEKRVLRGAVDGLLAELEKAGEAKVSDLQNAVVESVQLDRPEELVGQVERLKRLAKDKRAEVRRTAMWALGRTGDISAVPFLIAGLSDSNESVLREASLGLVMLSRRPHGVGLPLDPTEGLLEDASEDERLSHLERWSRESSKLWKAWYLRTRPYDERDDRTSLKAK